MHTKSSSRFLKLTFRSSHPRYSFRTRRSSRRGTPLTPRACCGTSTRSVHPTSALDTLRVDGSHFVSFVVLFGVSDCVLDGDVEKVELRRNGDGSLPAQTLIKDTCLLGRHFACSSALSFQQVEEHLEASERRRRLTLEAHVARSRLRPDETSRQTNEETTKARTSPTPTRASALLVWR